MSLFDWWPCSVRYSLLIVVLYLHSAKSQRTADNGNVPGAGLYGNINLPNEFLRSIPARSLLSGVNMGENQNQPQISAGLLNPSFGNGYGDSGSRQIQAALLRSLNSAVHSDSKSVGNERRLSNRQRDFLPYYPPYSPPYQQMAPQFPSYQTDFSPQQQQQPYYENYGSYLPNNYNNLIYPPVQLPRQSFGASSMNGFSGSGNNGGGYAFGFSPYQQRPIRHSENQFGYGVNAGVYAGTYGGSSASATPDGGPPTSYGGLSPWTIINGGTNTSNANNSSNRGTTGSGSVVPISLGEATGNSGIPVQTQPQQPQSQQQQQQGAQTEGGAAPTGQEITKSPS